MDGRSCLDQTMMDGRWGAPNLQVMGPKFVSSVDSEQAMRKSHVKMGGNRNTEEMDMNGGASFVQVPERNMNYSNAVILDKACLEGNEVKISQLFPEPLPISSVKQQIAQTVKVKADQAHESDKHGSCTPFENGAKVNRHESSTRQIASVNAEAASISVRQHIGSGSEESSMIVSSKRKMFNNLRPDFGLTTKSDNADVGVEQMSNVRLQYDGNMVQDGTHSKSDARSKIQECEEKRNGRDKAYLKKPPVKKKSRNIPKRPKSSYQLYILIYQPILKKKN